MAAQLFTDDRGRLCYDPDGRLYGLPSYPWRGAPDGLATYRQLAAMGLRPGGQDPVAQLLRFRRGRPPLVAYLYRVVLAKTKRRVTAAMQAALNKANAAKRTCDCGRDVGYVLPRCTGHRCWDCAGAPAA